MYGIEIQGFDGFNLHLENPLEVLIMAFVALVITELIKLPIKLKVKKSTGMAWVYILISLVVCTAVFLINDLLLIPVPGGFMGLSYEKFLALVALEQATYNFIWDKGLKKLVALIFSKITGKKCEDIEKVMDDVGIGQTLDKADSAIKDGQDKPEIQKPVEVVSTQVKKLEEPKNHNGRPRV